MSKKVYANITLRRTWIMLCSWQVNLLGVCDDPAILAQQLTHIEMVSDRNYHEFADGHTIAITSLVYSVR